MKSTIRAYYDATTPASPTRRLAVHLPDDKLATAGRDRSRRLRHRGRSTGSSTAIVFDADDTTLWTYDMEDAAMKFNFDPALQDVWVQAKKFPATPMMKRVVRGRGARRLPDRRPHRPQRRPAQGDDRQPHALYGAAPFKPRVYFTKWTGTGKRQHPSTSPARRRRARRPRTSRRPASTSRTTWGCTILANFGDQFSDLKGGQAERAYKLPNPTYYLP